MRIINVTVSNNKVKLSDDFAGASGSYKEAKLVFSFSDDWDDAVITLFFLNSKGLVPVYKVLGPADINTDGFYEYALPSEPLVYEGKMVMAIQGVKSTGAITDEIITTPAVYLRVEPAGIPTTSFAEAEVTPTLAVQLQAQITYHQTAAVGYRHDAEDVDYTGTLFTAADVKAALELLYTRINTIITTPATGVTAQEIIDARSASATLLDRLNLMVLMDGTRLMSKLTIGTRQPGTVGSNSFAQGTNNLASGANSHAEGFASIATGANSHAENEALLASGSSSHAEGFATTSSGNYSHAEGYITVASGMYSHAQNKGTKAKGNSQTAIGKYNIEDTLEAYAFIVGGGTDDANRANIFTMDWSGNFSMFGDSVFPHDKGPVITSPDGTKYRIIVANGGVLSTEVVT